MSKKVMDICLDGFHLVCIRTADKMNPFRVYRVISNHRRQIAKYGDFMSVVIFVRDLYTEGADTFTLEQLIQWSKSRGSL